MKARPILFSGPMIRALIDGRKTQTRRILKPQPQPNGGAGLSPVAPYKNPYGDWAWVLAATGHGSGGNLFSCPYGQPGDLLWVRESVVQSTGSTMDQSGEYTSHWGLGVKYMADGAKPGRDNVGNHFASRPSIHMPRWASRLTLEITDVRVERLQDISEADKLAEGGTPDTPFGTVWRKINTTPGIRWEDNPWVWAISFRVHQQNVDAVLAANAAA